MQVGILNQFCSGRYLPGLTHRKTSVLSLMIDYVSSSPCGCQNSIRKPRMKQTITTHLAQNTIKNTQVASKSYLSPMFQQELDELLNCSSWTSYIAHIESVQQITVSSTYGS